MNPTITLREIDRDNWREALELTVAPHELRFVADHQPIAAIALAKAYVRPGGLLWEPFGIYAGTEMVGFLILACQPESTDRYWVYHFFIDQAHQGRGYGRAGMETLFRMVRSRHPLSTQLTLTVHAENLRALCLYSSLGFRPTGETLFGEPAYVRQIETDGTGPR